MEVIEYRGWMAYIMTSELIGLFDIFCLNPQGDVVHSYATSKPSNAQQILRNLAQEVQY